jgi:hypothetical protein
MDSKRKQRADSFRSWCAFYQKENPTRAKVVMQNIAYD